MRTIQRVIVSALLFSRDGKLLMGMKDPAKGGVYSDCWHIPGGGIDDGEDELTALKREMMEEVGIDISGMNVFLVDDTGRGQSEKVLADGEKVLCTMYFHVYRVDHNILASEIETKLSDDLVKVEWVELKNVMKYKLTPPSLRLFAKLGWIEV